MGNVLGGNDLGGNVQVGNVQVGNVLGGNVEGVMSGWIMCGRRGLYPDGECSRPVLNIWEHLFETAIKKINI